VASRIGVVGAPFTARFWFSAFCIALMPTSVGYQDIASLIARERGASTSWHLIASPFGTIESATFNYTRPVGTAMPEPVGFVKVNFDPRSLDAYAWKIDEPLNAPQPRQIEYPTVDRAHKGDRLPASNAAPAQGNSSLPQLQPIGAPATPSASPPAQPPIPAPQPVNIEQHAAANDGAPLVVQMDVRRDVSAAMAPAAATADDDLVVAALPPGASASGGDEASHDVISFLDDNAGDHSAAIYFGTGTMGSPERLESWAPGAEPILASPSEESGIKLSALEGADYTAYESPEGGESIAGKDDTGRLESPAKRLGLQGKPLAKAEKCLADAVYFEARGEPYTGQEAVAQVVMNRVFSGYYPHDVCGVVFQNADRHLACQFTFACEGKDLSQIDEPDMWQQAKEIAKNMLDGKIWLADIGHATHYHAYWVHPSWVHEMVRLYRLGVHTFYRPRAWGDDEPTWSPAAVKDDARLDKPQAAATGPAIATATPSQNAAMTPIPNVLKTPQAAMTPIPDAAMKAPQAAATPVPGATVNGHQAAAAPGPADDESAQTAKL
jgi:Cell Wall Hydrolase